MENIQLYNGDCLEVMDKLIEQGVKVDAIITDPPYGTTACKWDSVIPFDAMWERLNKLIKPNGAIVLFGSEPFSSNLRTSNIKNYRYDLIWEKNNAGNFQLAKKQFLKYHENISVFYKKQPTYNPQGIVKLEKPITQSNKGKTGKLGHLSSEKKRETYKQEYTNYPKSILKFSRPGKPVHPTQKPVELLEYLIKTYTVTGETVLDFTMGSGSTGVACLNTNRKFIGIELDDKYFEIAKNRLKEATEKERRITKSV